jgi:hypothetical protein
LRIAGESENFGTEQEHLNNVFGARLRITALRGDQGPGVELLEYLAPRDGRPYPADEHANDIVDRQTILATAHAEQAIGDLSRAKAPFVSSSLVSDPARTLGFKKAVIVRDPDGHAVELKEE